MSVGFVILYEKAPKGTNFEGRNILELSITQKPFLLM